MTIGEKIKDLRKARGLTQSELATKCGYASFSNINKIETGKNNLPLSLVAKFAKALDVTPAYLMGWETAAKPYATVCLTKGAERIEFELTDAEYEFVLKMLNGLKK